MPTLTFEFGAVTVSEIDGVLAVEDSGAGVVIGEGVTRGAGCAGAV